MFRSLYVAPALLTLAVSCSDRSLPPQAPAPMVDPSFAIESASTRYAPELDAVVFEVEVAGDAASTTVEPIGRVDGAPVIGYVFPTTLDPERVGFGDVDGTLALAVTSHPDFDDTPLWNENQSGGYDDDGAVYHSHWVVLAPDDRAPANLAVVQAGDDAQLPPTAPMPMYLDSPGFTVVESGHRLSVIVPLDRIQRHLDFQVGALTAAMHVDTTAGPVLLVDEVLSQLDGGATSLHVEGRQSAPERAWPVVTDDADALQLTSARAAYQDDSGSFVLTANVEGEAAGFVPAASGAIDGAPVLGYVFATDIPPETVGFGDIAGTLVLAVTTHPDFDDTPLWDEDLDRNYGNDGAVYHVHWAVLVEDGDSPGGLSVPSQTDRAKLPPTAPMSMYLDSPGFHAFATNGAIHVVVPAWHLGDRTSFTIDVLTARMRVDASGAAPVLRVEEVIDSLPEALTASGG